MSSKRRNLVNPMQPLDATAAKAPPTSNVINGIRISST